MKNIFSLYFFLHVFILIAPPTGDLSSFEFDSSDNTQAPKFKREQDHTRLETSKLKSAQSKTKQSKIKKILPHKYQVNGRSPFEDELKTAFEARKKNPNLSREKSLIRAKELWNKSQNSYVPAHDFVVHLKDRYETSLHDIYSGEKNSLARKELEADLGSISPFLHKTWVDSFFVPRSKQDEIIRTDEPFFAWLNENPDALTILEKEYEKFPLEIAVNGQSSEMAKGILEIAKNHNISIDTLIEPLVEKYKLIYQSKGENAAYEYLQSIYDLHISEISHAIFEKLKNIHFPLKAQ